MDQRHQLSLTLVEADGVTSHTNVEVESQQSIYIPPGDERTESYRLSTFGYSPISSLTKRIALAKSGFYFTGIRDRAKCFACGNKVEKWEDSDNPADPKWHKQDCELQQGHECGNVPSTSATHMLTFPQQDPEHNGSENQGERREDIDISELSESSGDRNQPPLTNVVSRGSEPPATQPAVTQRQTDQQVLQGFTMGNVVSWEHKRYLCNLFLNRELERLASFSRWNFARSGISPVALARNGFFYLGNMDRIQCFSCGGVLRNWSPGDVPAIEHAKHFPNCKMAVGAEPRNIPVQKLPETLEEREQKYPCGHPQNAHMGNEQSRLGTFDQRWPTGKTKATPREIAEAGFFFLGERDKVKCWYCNGGLQNWEQDDVPWQEHAKWFPTCEFVLRNKGAQFVYRQLVNNAHLPRPVVLRPNCNQPNRPRSREGKTWRPEETFPSSLPPIINPKVAMRHLKERVRASMRSDNAQLILAMGFDEDIVAAQIENKLVSCGTNIQSNPNVYESASQLLEDVLKNEPELKKEVEKKNKTEEEIRKSAKEEGKKEALQELKEERMCKVCFNHPSEIVFIPCGHLCCCRLCSSGVTKCPVCRATIRSRIKVFVP